MVYPDPKRCNAHFGFVRTLPGYFWLRPDDLGGAMGNKTDKVTGKVKETTGRAVGDDKLVTKGRREQAKGDAKSGVKKLKDAAKKT